MQQSDKQNILGFRVCVFPVSKEAGTLNVGCSSSNVTIIPYCMHDLDVGSSLVSHLTGISRQ